MGRQGVRSFGIWGEINQRSFLSPLSPPPREEAHCHLVSSGAPAFSAHPPPPQPPVPSQPLLVSRLQLATLSCGASEATPKGRRSGQPGSREDMSTSVSLLESPLPTQKPPRPGGQCRLESLEHRSGGRALYLIHPGVPSQADEVLGSLARVGGQEPLLPEARRKRSPLGAFSWLGSAGVAL